MVQLAVCRGRLKSARGLCSLQSAPIEPPTRPLGRVQFEPWWDQHWVGAQNATSNVVRSAFRYVKQAYPYWNRTNGADHFLVYSYDRGAGLLTCVPNSRPRNPTLRKCTCPGLGLTACLPAETLTLLALAEASARTRRAAPAPGAIRHGLQ